MPEMIVIEELQSYLVTQGIGQLPGAAPSTLLPSIWLAPRDGSPLPRIGENITVTIIDTNLASPPGLMAWIDETFVDIIVRSRQASAGKLVQRSIKKLLVPFDAHGGRKQWMMNDLLVEASIEWRGDQPLPPRQNVGETDARVTYDRVASFRFACRRKILAGLTLP